MSRVKGQDHAADTIINQLAMRKIGLVAKKEQPQGTFLFTGPSGTGKTELVKALADHLGRKFLLQDEIREYLRDTGFFRVEMINRIENIVAFKSLGDDVKRDIVGKIIGPVLDNYNRTNGTSVKVRAEWLDRFSKLSDFTHGARDVQRMIQKELMAEIGKR